MLFCAADAQTKAPNKNRGTFMALVPSPQWLDTGNNAWQLAAATFVGLQSIPGLTVLYGGIVKKKWAINSAFMAMYAFASVLVVWVLFLSLIHI